MRYVSLYLPTSCSSLVDPISGQGVSTFFAAGVGKLRPRRGRDFVKVTCEVRGPYVDF
jgi:hypothetical protein